jgi:hypothetical protein
MEILDKDKILGIYCQAITLESWLKDNQELGSDRHNLDLSLSFDLNLSDKVNLDLLITLFKSTRLNRKQRMNNDTKAQPRVRILPSLIRHRECL